MNNPGRATFLSLLTAITLLSVLFRLGPLDTPRRPDEGYVAHNLMNFYRTGSPEPVHFIHPPLYHYLCWAALTPLLRSSGGGLYETYAKLYFSDPVDILSVCRLVGWIFSAALPPLLFLLAWRLYGAAPPAVIAGVLAAVSSWYAAHSRDALPDAPLAFFFTAAAGLALMGVKEKKRKFIHGAAFLGGLAAAIKTNGAFILPAVLAASWAMAVPGGPWLNRRWLTAVLCAAAVCAACAAGLYLTGAWEGIVLSFSPDGTVEDDSLFYFRLIMTRVFYLSAAVLALAGLLLRRLWQPGGGAPLLGRWQDKALVYLSGPDPYAAVFMFTAGFFILNPYWVILFKKFFSTLVLATIHVQNTGHFGMMGSDWTWYLASLWRGEGLVALLSGAGLLLAFRSRGGARAAAVFFLLLFFYVGAWEEKADRFIQVFMPLACLAAGWGLWDLAGGKKWFRRALISLIVTAGFLQAFKVHSAVLRESLPDSRISARAWLETSLPEGSAILLDRYFFSELHSFSDLEFIRTEFSSRGLPSVEEAYRGARIFKIHHLEELSGEHRVLQAWASFDFLALSSDSYWHLFEPAQEPPPGHSLRAGYLAKRDFYASVLRGELPWLKPAARFGGEGNSGPVIDVYKIEKK